MTKEELLKLLEEKEEQIQELEDKIQDLEDNNSWNYLTLTSEGIEEAITTFFSSASEDEIDDFNSKYPDIADSI